MLCGTMTRNVQDLDFLHHREGVNVILNVRPTRAVVDTVPPVPHDSSVFDVPADARPASHPASEPKCPLLALASVERF